MKITRHLVPVWIAVVLLAAVPAMPQQALTRAELDALRDRVQQLERQNTEFQEQLRLLRQELDSRTQPPSSVTPAGAPEAVSPEARLEALEEKIEVHAGRLLEHERVKVEGTQRAAVKLSGMLLFNAFANSRYGGGTDFPRFASIDPSPIAAGANFRQSVIGLEVQSPEAILGGQFRGAVFVDFFTGLDASPSNLAIPVRLRTAWIEGQWKTRAILVGQERPIFAPREPTSLARIGFTPLVGSGSLYFWEPQIRLEQKLNLGGRQELRARIGVVQTNEAATQRGIPAQIAALLTPRRPGVEGHFQFSHQFDDFRRIEIAPGFHRSTTHVAGVSVPANVFSLDWFFNPHRRVEFTGALFRGQNLVKFAGGGAQQGITVLSARPGAVVIIPVHTRGGWAQITLHATSRLSFNLYGGEDDPNNRDLPVTGVARNLTYAGNLLYRLAPNVVVALEASQARTRFMNGQHPLINHYDLAVAYSF